MENRKWKIDNRLIIFGVLVALAGAAFAQSAADPTRLAVGSRPLGMGKAYVGLADDASSVFLNPAGLANAKRWQVTSMSGRMVDDFNYISFSGLYPTNYGNLGLAYCSSSISGGIPTTIESGSDPLDPVFVADTSQQVMSYYNNLMVLSYADTLERALTLPGLSLLGDRFPGLKKVNFGANLKFFSVNLTGNYIVDGSGAGNELDLGLQGRPLPWLSLGGNVQNALPFAMGGKLRYATGWEESYPAILKVGAAVNVLGRKDSLRTVGAHSLRLLVDYDYELTRADYVDPLFHLGMEWKPLELIAIRAGIDQEMISKGEIANNFTSGVGIYFGDFRFDYAYHQFVSVPGVDNHFFSLSYGIAPVKVREITDPLLSSPDRLITTETSVAVTGEAVDERIAAVRVNGNDARMTPRGEFSADLPLNLGKNSLSVEAWDKQAKFIAADKLRVLRLITYPDVPADHWAAKQISYVGTLDLVKGYPNGTFKPEGNITRAELATLLIRAREGGDEKVPAAGMQIFKDVNLKHWAVKYINLAMKNDIVKGYPDGTFKPSANVTRAEGLAMIARFGGVQEQPYGNEFVDVTRSHWIAPLLGSAFKAGMLVYLKADPFQPGKKLTRAEAVELLYRTKPVGLMINELVDFETGY